MIQIAAITSVGNVGISLRIVSSAELPIQDLVRKARVVLDRQREDQQKGNHKASVIREIAQLECQRGP